MLARARNTRQHWLKHMNELRDSLEQLRETIGVEAEVTASGFSARCLAIVNLDGEILNPFEGDRQTSTVTLPGDIFPGGIPNRIVITELETGTVHHAVNVKHRAHDVICFCEIRDSARKFTGPFRP